MFGLAVAPEIAPPASASRHRRTLGRCAFAPNHVVLRLLPPHAFCLRYRSQPHLTSRPLKQFVAEHLCGLSVGDFRRKADSPTRHDAKAALELPVCPTDGIEPLYLRDSISAKAFNVLPSRTVRASTRLNNSMNFDTRPVQPVW